MAKRHRPKAAPVRRRDLAEILNDPNPDVNILFVGDASEWEVLAEELRARAGRKRRRWQWWWRR